MTTPREAIRQIIDAMRSEGPRYKSHDLGHVDSVSSSRVDDWADEVATQVALLESAPTPPPRKCPKCSSEKQERIAGLWLCNACGHEWDDPVPSPPPGAALRTLVTKWRENNDVDGHAHDPAVAFAQGVLQCADELEAALGQAEARAPEQGCAYCYTNSRGFEFEFHVASDGTPEDR
jgi:ribosomal protein L37AE/L43A